MDWFIWPQMPKAQHVQREEREFQIELPLMFSLLKKEKKGLGVQEGIYWTLVTSKEIAIAPTVFITAADNALGPLYGSLGLQLASPWIGVICPTGNLKAPRLGGPAFIGL